MDNFFKEILKKIPKKIRNYNRLSMGIAGRIDDILEEREISQREFAKKMKKSESEISKWMSGKHNFTIKSIANIEAMLDAKLIYTEYDLEEVKIKLDKQISYIALFKNQNNILSHDLCFYRISAEGEVKFDNNLVYESQQNIIPYIKIGDVPSNEAIIKPERNDDEFFEPLKDIVSYNAETQKYEVKSNNHARFS